MCDQCKPISKNGKLTIYSPASASTFDLNMYMRGQKHTASFNSEIGDDSNYAQTKEDLST